MYEFPPTGTPFSELTWTTAGFHALLLGLAVIVVWLACRQRAVTGQVAFCAWFLLLFLTLPVAAISLPADSSVPVYLTAYSLIGFSFAAIGAVRAAGGPSEGPQGFQDVRSIGCMAVVASLVLLFFSQQREVPGYGSLRIICKNNLRQLGNSFHDFHDKHGHFPHAAGHLPGANSVNPPLSWRVAILPFAEHRELFARYDPSTRWDLGSNIPLQNAFVSFLHCPAKPEPRDSATSKPFFTSYVVPTGPHTIFGRSDSTPPSYTDMTDGSSNTLMILEACGTEIVWSSPVDADVSRTPIGINLPGSARAQSDGLMSSYHPNGALTAVADGSVRYISDDIDPEVLKQFLTADADDGPVDHASW